MKNSVENVNANIKDKRLTKIFLQGLHMDHET